jgi:RNA polymerase sigma-70 factor (ECF subfamily)
MTLFAALLIGLGAVLHLSAGAGAAGPASDEDLFARYVAGDDRAFEELFRRYATALCRVMRRQIRSSEEASELVQQTFLQLHRARHDFRTGAQLRPWLYTIALNLRREAVRRRIRQGSTHSEAPERLEQLATVAAHDPTLSETRRQVQQALADLPEGQRTVISLHWFDGLSFGEVAEVVGANLSAVKVRAHRGYRSLRLSLEAKGAASTIGEAAGSGAGTW